MALLNDDEEELRVEGEEEEEETSELGPPEPGETPLEDLGVDEGFTIFGSDSSASLNESEASRDARRALNQSADEMGLDEYPRYNVGERGSDGSAPSSASLDAMRMLNASARGMNLEEPYEVGRQSEPGESPQVVNRALDGVGASPSESEAGSIIVPNERRGWRGDPELRALSDRNRELMGLSSLYRDDGSPIASAPPASRVEPEPEPEGRVRYDAQETVSDEPFSIRDLPTGPPEFQRSTPRQEQAAREHNEAAHPSITAQGGIELSPLALDPRAIVEASDGAETEPEPERAQPAPAPEPASPAPESADPAMRAQGLGDPSAPASRVREQLGDPSAEQVREGIAELPRGPREQLREDIAELERLRQEPDRTGRDIGRVFQRIINAIGSGMQALGGQRPGPNLLARRFAAEDARDERDRARRMSARQDILRRRMAADERAAARGERRAERAEDRSSRQRERAEDRDFR